MPASFKVRTVPLDGNNFEEVLDPDFGESAIGRVAPVDSGYYMITVHFCFSSAIHGYSSIHFSLVCNSFPGGVLRYKLHDSNLNLKNYFYYS